jgi:MoxR-like ATPase
MGEILRPRAESIFQDELLALKQEDSKPRPPSWLLSPHAVVQYLMGATLSDGTIISPKYIGSRRLIEVAVATLATDRALLLVGVPGTAKTWVAEHLAAAISGHSGYLVQGSAGIGEEALKYTWNYARLLSHGPDRESLVPSPVFHAMEQGLLVRIEELTRLPAEVQDALITVLSEKIMPIPELNDTLQAKNGFNLIATANDRDRGINELSGALRRRFNMVFMPLPETMEEEILIIKNRVEQSVKKLGMESFPTPTDEIKRIVTIFRELRNGQTIDGQQKLKSPSSTLSTAEAIEVVYSGQMLAYHFGNGQLKATDIAAALSGAIVKDTQNDLPVWKDYLQLVVKDRDGWKDLYRACRELL